MSIGAKVTGWTDGGQADCFEDEHGYEWKYAVDAADATIAVERADGSKAGVFSWDAGTEDAGSISVVEDGATYDVNNSGEYVAQSGEWKLAEEVANG